MGETSGYEIMAETNVNDKLDSDINEFIVITKTDHNTDETMDTVETLMNQSIESNEQTNEDTEIKESNEYFDDNLNSTEEVTDNFYNDCFTSVMLEEAKVKEEWISEDYPMSHDKEDDGRVIENEGDENSDEETIATFITSAGQQLALYAVEDSDEVFAVAVYSESGEPPSNFQFLMKADVERLIGEGAVRTVKKPQQMKKQTYQGELISPRDKEMYRKSIKNSPTKLITASPVKNTKKKIQQCDITPSENFIKSPDLMENKIRKANVTVEKEEEEEEEEQNSINDDLTYQDILDSSYFLLEQETNKRIRNNEKLKLSGKDEKIQEPPIVKLKNEENEQSTVQYILCDDDQSDTELTFDEIKKSLQHFDKNKKVNSLLKKPKDDEKLKIPEKKTSNGLMNSPASPLTSVELKSPQTHLLITTPVEKPIRRLQSSTGRHKHIPNALLGRKSYVESKQTVIIQGSTALICCPISDMDSSMDTSFKESSDPSSKIKRPRKQQLTIVDRADSEIIIQPASMVSDEEEEPVPKKRGRRKKRRQENNPKNTMKTKSSFSKRIRSSERRPRIEIIDIDIDNDAGIIDDDEEENGYQQRRSNIKEVITIDDGKEKDSSDKENEVIMVGDSDDDDDDEDDEEDDDDKEKDDEVAHVSGSRKKIGSLLKCDHCNRSFRQKHALETHSRICPKSPTTRRRLKPSRGSSKRTNETRSMLKKQYVCKICEEKFDVVVALARHVRSHYKKKETVANVAGGQMKRKEVDNKSTISTPSVVIKENTKTKRQLVIEQKSKERSNSHRGWNTKKMSCIDCGRWFASAALLSAHSLQHATKKTEKQIKRCQICRKLFRSRLIYIRHMHMHSNAKQLQKRIRRTRQSTSTITTLRKRGRPRKL